MLGGGKTVLLNVMRITLKLQGERQRCVAERKEERGGRGETGGGRRARLLGIIYTRGRETDKAEGSAVECLLKSSRV